MDARIAVLFDAENINCDTATKVLRLLNGRGSVPIRRAVGDFSLAALAAWSGCARDNGIELVMQQGLGKGKNAADIRLTIEAMDIVHQRRIDTVALVTRDRDFAPLALRLRHAELVVLGFAQHEPTPSFRAACSSFTVLGRPERHPAARVEPATAPILDKGEVARLRQIALRASAQGPIPPGALTKAIIVGEPNLAARLSGQAKFLKTLVVFGIVERVGSGADLLVQATPLKRAG